MQKLNLIDTAITAGIFQTFTRLLEGTALEKQLRSHESFTVFAPVDISFASLAPEVFDRLLRTENQQALSDVLAYHVVPRKIMFHELLGPRQTPTVYGVELTIDSTIEPKVGGAQLLHVDIIAWNGVIHAIDRLLIPAASAAAAAP